MPKSSHTPLVIAIVVIFVSLCVTAQFLIGALAVLHLQTSKQVRLPVAPGRIPADPTNTMIVLLKADEVAYVDGQPESDDAVLAEIRQRQPGRIRLVADRRVRYERVKSLLLKLGAASPGKVIVSVANDAPKSPGTPPPNH